MACTVGVDYSVDKRQTWTSLGSTTKLGVVAFDTGSAPLPVASTFWIRVWWEPTDTKYYLYLPGLDFGDSTVNHRLRKVELSLRDGGNGHTTFVDDITVWNEPVVERQQYFTARIMVERASHEVSGHTEHRSVFKQYKELSSLLDDDSTLEPPTAVVEFEDPFGQKWDAMVVDIQEVGEYTPAGDVPGAVLELQLLLLRKIA